MKKNLNVQTFTFGLLLFIILFIYLIAFQVPLGKTAIVTTFGKPVRVIEKPGLYWKAPWPIQEVYIFDTKIIVTETKMEEIYTADGKNLILTGGIFWRIKDPLKFFTTTGDIESAEKKIISLVRNFKNGIIGTYQLSNLINVDVEQLKLDEIQERIKTLSSEEAEKIYGIEILDYVITKMQFPQDVTADVFERMRKERERIAEKYLAEGEGIANDIKSKAEAERDKILAEAKAQAMKIKGEGDAVASKYYDVFTKNQDLAIFLKKLQALENTLKNNTTVILDSRTPPYDLFMKEYLEQKNGTKK